MAIKAGLATTVICGYGRDSWSRTHSSKEANVRNETRPDSQLAQEFGPEYGYFGAVAAHAFGATRHMHLYGTTRDQFGEIAVAFREHALRNPDAQMKKPLTHRKVSRGAAGRVAVRALSIAACAATARARSSSPAASARATCASRRC